MTKLVDQNCCSKGARRLYIAWMTCVGMTLILAKRSEMGIAILRLTGSSGAHASVDLPRSPNNNLPLVNWSNTQIGLIESAFSMGYGLNSVPAGLLVLYFRAHLTFGCSIGFSCMLNLLIPLAVHVKSASFGIVFAIRLLQGLCDGMLYPSIHALWALWAPKQERSRLASISFFGIGLGPILGFPLTGLLAQNTEWYTSFFVFGCLGMAWSVVWLATSSSDPITDTFISQKEIDFIQENYDPKVVRSLRSPDKWKMICGLPWLPIFTSLPVWAIIAGNVGKNSLNHFAVTGLPKYFEDAFKTSMQNIGFLLMVPFFCMAIMTPISGSLSTCVQLQFDLKIGLMRKIFNTIGFMGIAIFLVLLGFCMNVTQAITCLSIALGCLGVGLSGFAVNHLDIAPQYAGFLIGISNGIGTIGGVIFPNLATQLTTKHTKEEWMFFFGIMGTFIATTAVIFLLFSSGEVQPWAEDKDESESEPINTEDAKFKSYNSVEAQRRMSAVGATK